MNWIRAITRLIPKTFAHPEEPSPATLPPTLRLILEKSGLPKSSNAILQAKPNTEDILRPVYIGWHDVGGAWGKAVEILLDIPSTPGNIPDLKQHCGVIVGDYLYIWVQTIFLFVTHASPNGSDYCVLIRMTLRLPIVRFLSACSKVEQTQPNYIL